MYYHYYQNNFLWTSMYCNISFNCSEFLVLQNRILSELLNQKCDSFKLLWKLRSSLLKPKSQAEAATMHYTSQGIFWLEMIAIICWLLRHSKIVTATLPLLPPRKRAPLSEWLTKHWSSVRCWSLLYPRLAWLRFTGETWIKCL